MIKPVALKDKAVDKKIDAFCESSAKLLESIHARYGSGTGTVNYRGNRAKKKVRKKTSIMELDRGTYDEEGLSYDY